MVLERGNALGMFPDLQLTESALSQLKETGFPMNKVSVVPPQLDSDKPISRNVTEPIVASEQEATSSTTVDRIQQGAIGAGAMGSVVGGVVAGLTTLAFPAFSGAVVLVGMTAGAFYGALSGGLLNGGIGVDDTKQQTKHYSDLLAQGYYMVVIKGTESEIDRAESVFKAANIQEWMIFNPS
jgi:uncharacterized membrane protein